MVTTGGIEVGLDLNDEDKTDSLYHGGVTAYNPNIENTSGSYWDPEAERRWKERAAEINAQRRLEKKIEKKVYKRLIKELLKKI
jgi:Holliday junction resolvase RusA-like endonuclease